MPLGTLLVGTPPFRSKTSVFWYPSLVDPIATRGLLQMLVRSIGRRGVRQTSTEVALVHILNPQEV
jgi:hypothetical protein